MLQCGALAPRARLSTQAPPASSEADPERLQYPLPAGLRDLLPREAEQLARVGSRVMQCLELWGYQRVSVPAFELASVMQKWLGPVESSSMLHFVDPESGEIVALRPDMTPQVARLVATELRAAPSPVRLCYQGSVLRRRQERARLRRQVHQTGFELIGVEAEGGDAEVLQVASDAVRAAGLSQFTLDLGHAAICNSLVEGIPAAGRQALLEALAMKDTTLVERSTQELNLDAARRRALCALPELHGGDEVWPRAQRALQGTAAQAPAASLQRLWQWATERQIASSMIVDLGELSALDYYTGITFHILAHGPGEAVGSGGRYDGLFEQFAAPRPAAGFAVDLGNLCWALAATGQGESRSKRVLLRAESSRASQLEEGLLAGLRSAQVPCARSVVEASTAGDYARHWGFDVVLTVEGNTVRLQLPGEQETLTHEIASTGDPTGAVVAWVMQALGAPGNG